LTVVFFSRSRKILSRILLHSTDCSVIRSPSACLSVTGPARRGGWQSEPAFLRALPHRLSRPWIRTGRSPDFNDFPTGNELQSLCAGFSAAYGGVVRSGREPCPSSSVHKKLRGEAPTLPFEHAAAGILPGQRGRRNEQEMFASPSRWLRSKRRHSGRGFKPELVAMSRNRPNGFPGSCRADRSRRFPSAPRRWGKASMRCVNGRWRFSLAISPCQSARHAVYWRRLLHR
jgi:hypothetical protein